MKVIDRTNLCKEYKGQWVALAKDRVTVLGAGRTLKAAMKKAQKNSTERPSYTRIPDTLRTTVNVI